MAEQLRSFEATSYWSQADGRPTERALGWMRAFERFVGAGAGTVPISSLGGDGISTVTFLREDGSWSVPAYPSGANPSASVGTSATNGSSTTFMRSDAAPAINLGITPTWTNLHTFSGGVSTTTLVSTGSATIGGAFGCNGKTAQTAASANAAVSTAAGAAYTAAEQAILNANSTLTNQIRAALIANGIMV